MPMGPLPLDKVVDGFRAVDVVPHPLYPAPSVCFMSDLGSSPLLLAPATTGNVGSLLGLKPYSSTSFLRSSSASFRCFLFRQRKRAAITINATAATGTTTATAILPPADRPEAVDALEPEVVRAADPDVLDDDDDVFETRVVDSVGKGRADDVDVTIIVAAPSDPVVAPLALVAAEAGVDTTVVTTAAGPEEAGVAVTTTGAELACERFGVLRTNVGAWEVVMKDVETV